MLLSVVMPVHNVAGYLEAAMQSMLASAPRPLQVLAVDDGSTDDSPAILRRLAAAHPDELTVITTPNSGSGAARNLASGRATGEFLTFVDPDDIVLPETHDRLVRLLQRTGSDFAVCHFERLQPDGSRSSLGWADRVHGVPRERAVLDDVPEILGDVFCWNKVFRRTFWQGHGIRFPEGTRYQDQPPITEAFLSAAAFDVDPRTGYLWRVRDDGSSVTQGRADLGNLRDRRVTKLATWDLVREHASPTVIAEFHDRVMPGDLHQFFNAVPGCDDAYWDLLRAMVLELWGPEHSLALTRLLPSHRLMGWLVEQGRRDDAERLWRRVRAGGGPLPARPDQAGTGLRLDTSALLVGPVPDDVARLRPDEIGWSATAESVRRRRRDLEIRGAVRVGRLGVERPFRLRVRSPESPVLTCTLDTPHGPVTLTGPVKVVPSPPEDC